VNLQLTWGISFLVLGHYLGPILNHTHAGRTACRPGKRGNKSSQIPGAAVKMHGGWDALRVRRLLFRGRGAAEKGRLMNRRPAATILCGVLLAALAPSSVEASSYQKTDGTIVNPIYTVIQRT